MRGIVVVLCLGLAVCIATEAIASPEDDKKACVINAAQKLPVIPGLEIVNVSTSVLEKPKKKDDALIWQINIDFTAAKQEVIWSFACAMMPDGNPRAQRVK
jgi:hypothetical protein